MLDKERSMFLQQFSDCFSDSLPSQLLPERIEDHAIDLVPGSSPPNRPPYRVSAAQQKEIMSQIEELLETRLIQPNSSPFCSPVLLMQKKDGSWRMCIDYRALNKNTIKNRFPIPRIDDILDKLEGAAMVSKIDLKSGYHQIRIRSEDVHKTAFRTTFGLYEFLVMLFGLTKAPATVNRMMGRTFRPHQQFVGTFFDDMIVYSKNEEEHRQYLVIVIKELRSHRLLINAKKSEIFLEEIHFLGHIVSKDGVRMDPTEVEASKTWPDSKTVLDVRSFLRLCSYYRRTEGVGDKWMVDAPLVDFIPGLPAFHLTELPRELLEAIDVSNFRFQFMLKAFAGAKDADKILVHSLYELESHVYESMQAQGFPITPVGPLLSDTTSNSVVRQSDQCLEWLDQQDPASVVYVAFGTIAKLSLQEMHSLALGLEVSGRYFVWVIQMKSLPASSLHESLPDGFIERTVSQGRGIIVTWAPQMEVLKHNAVGAFISHCGWNSTLESVWEGVPMVACPRAADQRCNARHIVKVWKFGVEMKREDNGTFTAEAVKKAIEEVMGNQEVKERAFHFKQVARDTFANGPSHSNIVNFVDYLFHLPVSGIRCS
ncbi:hypothetical protein L7F22_001126 [Adiantum nelumboides]|nr:hypothetical protein [Adiantum nelumboides]